MLLQVPLFEFVQTESAESSNLTAIRGHYLLCDATTLAAICAVQHRDTGTAERQGVDYVKRVFVDIGLSSLISACLYWNSQSTRIFLDIKCGINLIRYWQLVTLRRAPVAGVS